MASEKSSLSLAPANRIPVKAQYLVEGLFAEGDT